jgi:hypothetical protein
MNPNRKKITIACALYLIGFIIGILSISSDVDDSTYLIKVLANANQVVLFNADSK